MRMIQLTDYEYMMCVLFSEESARSQQKIEFGNKATAKRVNRDIREDTLCGKMAEVAFAKMLREDYKLHLPVNYEVYPRGEWDDEDIIVNGKTIDIKSTKRGKFLLIENSKIDFRQKQGKTPDIIVMCRTDVEYRSVEILGCISTKKLTDSSNTNVKRLKTGDYIPGTTVSLKTDNYCIKVEDLCDVNTAFDYITKQAV